MPSSAPTPTTRPYGGPLEPAVVIFGATALWCITWWLLRPAERENQFFREGGPIDLLDSVWLMGAALFAWCAWMIASDSPLRRFWLVVAVGTFALGLDERFQFHELISRMPASGEAPLGFRNWTDIIVLGYGAIAGIIVLITFKPLWRARGLRTLGLVTFGCAAISAGIDTLVATGEQKDIIEETFKVFFGAGLFLTCLEGFALEVRRRNGRAWRRTLPSPLHACWLLALAGGLAWATLGGDDRWHELVSRYWGSAHSWVVCVLLWTAALFGLVGWLFAEESEGPQRGFGSLLVLLLGFLGVGEGIRATRIQTMHDRVIHQFPGSHGLDLAVLHDPLSITRVLTLLVFAALLVLTATPAARRMAGHRWMAAAVALLPAALLVNLLGGGSANGLYAPILRIAGATCALLGTMTWCLAGARRSLAAP